MPQYPFHITCQDCATGNFLQFPTREARREWAARHRLATGHSLTQPIDPDLVTVLQDIIDERANQDAKWGEQNHPDGTGPGVMWAGYEGIVDADGGQIDRAEDLAKYFGDQCKANGPGEDNYLDILLEEVAEAFAEQDPARLRTELIQVAAVAVQWVQAIDRRTSRAEDVLPPPNTSALATSDG